MNDHSKEVWDIILHSDYVSIDSYCDASEHIVYHYTSPEGLLNILQVNNKDSKNAKLWFTRYDSLNDKSERENIIEYLKEYCDRKVFNKKISQSFAEAIKQIQLYDDTFIILPDEDSKDTEENQRSENGTKIRSGIYLCNTYLCCFSREPDLLPMWNYYSKSQRYEGYNIGFWSSIFGQYFSFKKGYSIELKRVIYSNEEKDEILDKIILPFNELYMKSINDREDVLRIIQDKVNELQFVFKKEYFKHEDEIRAILRIPREILFNKEQFKEKYRNSHGYIVPYIEYSISKETVKQIVIGPLLKDEIAKKNINEMLQKCGYDNVIVKSSHIPIRF